MKGSCLWVHPRITITPHVAALSLPEDVAKAFQHNLQIFLSPGTEKTLNNVVKWEAGY